MRGTKNKRTTSRFPLEPRAIFRKQSLFCIVVILIIAYMLLSDSDFFFTTNKQGSAVDHAKYRQNMRRPSCHFSEYPNLNFGHNRTSAYHDANERSSGEDEVISSDKFTNYSDFKVLLQSLIARRLIHFGDLPINAIFVGQPHYDIPHPFCDGLWLEFVIMTYFFNVRINQNIDAMIFSFVGCVSRWKHLEDSCLENKILW